MSLGQWGCNPIKNMLSCLTFSIFLCGCKLSGTFRSSNLSTLSAAKIQNKIEN